MCAAVSVVPAGKPENVPLKLAVAAVMLFEESRVTTNVIVMVPEPVDSVLVIAGTSFAGRKSAVNVGLVGVWVGEVFDFEQAATPMASIATTTDKRFIV